ncbi:hypothetical protein PHJA_001283800 [Phtheirospermum japonicum]|uniref:Uncharacterized protein n=1 Tax=Phtheirospermum japonicum TaxID=374723 RepID=A0A830C2P8_9LAMI|nr:hypothetical protein PHJA_001283800 [Phtheirospermum japonicum]
MNGAVEVRKPPVAADVSIFEFGSVGGLRDKVTLVGFSDATTDPPPSPADIFPEPNQSPSTATKVERNFQPSENPIHRHLPIPFYPEPPLPAAHTDPKSGPSPPYHRHYLSDPSHSPY